LSKKVLIVGAGIGGLATAVRLLSQGYEVTIFEKEAMIGGKIQPLKTGTFNFDLTASILMTPMVYQELFSFANRDYRNYLEFIKINPNYRAHYEDGTLMDFSSNLADLTKALETISIKDSLGFIKFLTDFYERYIIADRSFFQKSFDSPSDLLKPNTLWDSFKLHTLSTAYSLISSYVENEKLRKFLCFQALYIGISPFNGPSIYALIPAVTELYGLWHLKGGLYSYIEAMGKLINEFGGSIETNSPVEEILISKGKAVGIKTNTAVEYGDIVICNADFPYAVKDLIKDEKYKGKYTDEKLESLKYTCSNFVMYLGLKKKYPVLKVHNQYLGSNFKDNTEAAFEGKLPLEPPLYFYCPSVIDDSMAPNSKDCLSIVVRVPNLFFDEIKWNEDTINTLRERVFSILRSIRGLEDIEKNIEYESYLTPVDLKNRFNSYGGTAYGLSPTLMQTNYFRPHIKSGDVENLYFVGSSIHPGPGASIVLIGSKLVAEDIIYNSCV
jgi:phytoene desaturase